MALDVECAALFIERFPRYVFHLPVWEQEAKSVSDAPANDRLCDELPLKHIEVLYLYGIGDGSAAIQLESWLNECANHRLIFLEPSPSSIIHSLKQPFAMQWLSNKQVEVYQLATGPIGNFLLEELAFRYPLWGVYVYPNGKSDPKQTAKLRMRLMGKTARTYAHFVEGRYRHRILSNLLQNLPKWISSAYLNSMKDAFKDIPAVICGAGPSLNAAMPFLKQMDQKALIIAGGSAIAALSSQGIQPHLCAAIDPTEEEFLRFKNSFAFEAPLIYSTRLCPKAFCALNGPLIYARSGMSGETEMWFESQMGLKEPSLEEILPATALSVTNLAIGAAVLLGCNPILFDGLDLAYADKCEYAAGVDAAAKPTEDVNPFDRKLLKKGRKGKRVLTAVRWVMESNAISRMVKMIPERRWIDCTAGGLGLKEVEEMPLSEAMQLLPQERDLRGFVHAVFASHSLPKNAQELFEKSRLDLEQSLDRVMGHLEVLIKGEPKAQCILSEIDIQEEIAYRMLFWDIRKALRSEILENDQQKYWKAFLEVAQDCKQSFNLNR